MAKETTFSVSIFLFLSLLMLCSLAHGQLLTRRQQFNLQRQQKQLDEQENVLARQSASQNNRRDVLVNTARFERLFEAIRTLNELLQALSAIRARLNSDSSQLASLSLANISNQ